MASASASLGALLDAAARGVFPPPDGSTTVVPQAAHRDAGVIAFTAHSVVFTDEDPEWVRSTHRATRAACGPSRRRGTGRWGRRPCSSRGEQRGLFHAGRANSSLPRPPRHDRVRAGRGPWRRPAEVLSTRLHLASAVKAPRS